MNWQERQVDWYFDKTACDGGEPSKCILRFHFSGPVDCGYFELEQIESGRKKCLFGFDRSDELWAVMEMLDIAYQTSTIWGGASKWEKLVFKVKHLFRKWN